MEIGGVYVETYRLSGSVKLLVSINLQNTQKFCIP